MRTTLAGIRRTLGMAPTQKAPALTADVRRLVATCPDDTRAGVRDRALLLLGFAGGFPRSELLALDVADLEQTTDGLRIRIARSTTDREGAGQGWIGMRNKMCRTSGRS